VVQKVSKAFMAGTAVEFVMPKKPTKAKVETRGSEPEPLSNVERLRTHLNADSLAVTLLDAWKSAEPQSVKAQLVKAVQDYFNEKKQGDGTAGPKD
jgi:hypothetical protein